MWSYGMFLRVFDSTHKSPSASTNVTLLLYSLSSDFLNYFTQRKAMQPLRHKEVSEC